MTEVSLGQHYVALQKILAIGPEAEALLSKISSFEICENPRMEIASRGHEKWAICWSRMCFTSEGRWDWESMPSSRTDDFIAATRFSLSECFSMLEHAHAVALQLQAEAREEWEANRRARQSEVPDV